MKNQIQKALIAGLLLLLVGVFSGCSQTGKDEKEQITIGVVVYDEYDTFLAQMMDSFMNEVSKQIANGRSINVLRYESGGSQIIQNEQVEEMLDKGCDVLCVNLVDRTDPTMIIESARKKEVPVVFFNRELVEKDLKSWDKLYYIGADAFESGTIEGQIAADCWLDSIESDQKMDKNGDGVLQYVNLEGEAGHQDAIVRTEYSVKSIVEAGIAVDKLDSVIANWNRAQAQNKMSQLINKYGEDIELIMCNNDDMALGVIDEYDSREIPKEERPVIVGIDGTAGGLEVVSNGKLYGTVYNDKEGQAKSILALAIAAATGEGYDELELFDGKYIRYPYARITRENVADFMNE